MAHGKKASEREVLAWFYAMKKAACMHLWDVTTLLKPLVEKPTYVQAIGPGQNRPGTNDGHWSRVSSLWPGGLLVPGQLGTLVPVLGMNRDQRSSARHVACGGALVPVHAKNRDQCLSCLYIHHPISFLLCFFSGVSCEMWLLVC